MTKRFKDEKHKAKILDRIQKLLNTAKGTKFEAEAETAMRMAQGYMKSYGVSMTEVELQEDLKGEIVHEILDKHSKMRNPEKWECYLCIAVAIIFDCEAIRIIDPYKRWDRGTSKMSFTGYKEDVEMAKTVFTVLYVATRAAACKILPKGAGKPRLSFMMGVATTLVVRAKAEKKEARKEPTGRYDLVVVEKSKVVSSWVSENVGKIKNSNRRAMQMDAEAYEKGRKFGKGLDLMNKEKVEDTQLVGLPNLS